MPGLVEIGLAVLEKQEICGSGEEDLNFVNTFLLFRNYLPLEKGETLYLKQIEFPSPKDALYQVWLKLAHWFWRRR